MNVKSIIAGQNCSVCKTATTSGTAVTISVGAGFVVGGVASAGIGAIVGVTIAGAVESIRGAWWKREGVA